MKYGKRRYSGARPPVAAASTPTYVCSRCGRIRVVSDVITLTGIIGTEVSLTGRICTECGKLLKDWLNLK